MTDDTYLSGPTLPADPAARSVWWDYDDTDEGAPAFAYVFVEIPYWAVAAPGSKDWNPPEWWLLEALTGISAGRFRSAKSAQEFARLMDDVVVRLETARYQAGLAGWKSNQASSLESWCLGIVHARFRLGIKPYCFTSRAGDLAPRALTLAIAGYGPGLSVFRIAQPEGYRLATVRREREAPVGWGQVGAPPFRLRVVRDLDAAAQFLSEAVTFSNGGYPSKQVHVPRPTAAMVRAEAPSHLPELRGMSHQPVPRADGTYAPTGYDPATERFIDPHFEPSAVGSLAEALHTALYPFLEFPMVHGWGPLLALLLESSLKNLVASAPRPLFVIDAPKNGQGTGKTLLARTVGSLILGTDPGVGVLPSGEGELEKRITAVVRSQAPVHIFDNVTGTVRSNALATLATSTSWGGRKLGLSETIQLPQHTTWVLTSNEAKLSRDLARRCLFIRLDAGVPEAWKRSGFTIRNPPAYVRDHREGILNALNEIVRGWLVHSRQPAPRAVGLGSYEEWTHFVGGILAWVDQLTVGRLGLLEGLVAAASVGEGRDEDRQDMLEFAEAWSVSHGTNWVIPGELVRVAEDEGLFAEMLQGAANDKWRARKLAQEVLGTMRNLVLRLSSGFWVVEGPERCARTGRNRLWRLKPCEATPHARNEVAP